MGEYKKIVLSRLTTIKIEFEKVHNISTLRIIFKFVKLEGKKALAATRLCIAYNKEINMSDEKSHGKPIPFASRL